MPDDERAHAESAGEFAGVPDGLERLWTPHRMVYLGGQDKPAGPGAADCPFCRAQGRTDTEALVVARGKLVFALLNLYPYNSGHLMVLPYRHVADYTDLSVAEAAELSASTRTAIEVLRVVMQPQQGPAAQPLVCSRCVC